MTFKKYGVGLAVAAALGVAGSAQAGFIGMIDDMAYTGSSTAVDTTAGGTTPVSANRGTGGSGAWVDGSGNRSSGSLWANLIAGDSASTQDCANCQVSHTVNASNTIAHQYFRYGGDALDFDAGTTISFDYETDIAGGDFVLSFSQSGSIASQVFQWSDVGATGLTGNRALFSTLSATLTAELTGVTGIFLDVFSSGGTSYQDSTGWLPDSDYGISAAGLDTNFADLQATNGIPEPTTLAMLGLGLAGIGWQRRRKSA